MLCYAFYICSSPMELLGVIKIQFGCLPSLKHAVFQVIQVCLQINFFSKSLLLQPRFHIQSCPTLACEISKHVCMGYEKSFSKVQLPVLMRPWTPTCTFSIILAD